MIYLTNGNTPLNEAYNDEIIQEHNNTYQLTFRFPTSDSKWELLKEETFLTADDLHGEQDFYIFEVEKQQGYIQVYANQVFTLLNNYVVNPISLDRQTGSTALSRFAGSITRDNPFSFFSNIEDRHTFNIGSKNAMEVFAKDKHSIVGQWGGDLVRHGYQVRLLKNGGSENESLFMYKKNLSSYQHKTSTKSLKTRITFKTTVKGEGEKAPDRKFSVIVDSPLINKYSQIYEDVIEVNDQDVKDEASLRKYGEQYYRTSLCDMLEDSLEIEVIGQTGAPVQMFDVVSIFHEHYNLDVRKKITKYTYSPMAKKLKSIGFGRFQSGLANAIGNAVSDAVKGEAQQLQDDFERQLARELKNADLAFDRQKEELVNQFTDELNATKAKAEEVKQDISNEIDKRFQSYDNTSIQEARRKAEEALRNAGASSLLAQEAKQIGLDSIAKLEEFKRRATNAQAALSGDLDGLKQTVTSEVNQASEHRRTTTEALSRMTGQMNGFATKSEVKQDIDGLTQAFAKMKVGSRNYAEDYDFSRGLWNYSQGDNSPQDWTISNGEYNVKGTTKTWKQMQIHSKEGSRASGKNSTALLDLELGETYTLSFQGICYSGNPSVWVTLRANRTTPGNTEVIGGRFTLTSSWQTYQVTIPALTKPDNFDFWRIILGYDEIGHVAFRKVELTRSSTRIDAGPAPEDGKTDLVVAKSEFKKTAEGLSAKMTAVESYVDQDGQRQEALRRYTREESARQATAVREQISKDYVGKNTFQESVQGVERRLESLSLGTSGNLLKNSNDGFYNQNNKKYRLVETLQANQVYTLVSKYWNGENATGHTFLDGIGKWRHLTYNSAIDAWMVQFTPTQKIPAGTEITLSSDPGRSVGNMSWATLVRGAIPLIHWQPAKGDIEEGVTHKLAEYKETVDGRFATISSQINGKANQADFQRVKETSQLYERILGNSENGITNNVARMALTNQLFQVEVAKNLGSDNNLIVRSKSMDRHTLVNEGNTKRVFVNDGIFTIQCAGNSGYTFAGFTLPLYIDRMARGETYTLNFKYRIMGRLDHEFTVVAKNHQANEGIFSSNIATSSTAVSSNWQEFTETYNITKDFGFGTSNLYPIYFYLAKNGWIEIKEIMLVRAAQTNGYKASQFDDMSEAVRSVQSQLAGSWAVQNINSAGDIISGINLGANGHNRFDGKLTHITGETLIDKAVIKSAMVDKLKTANFETGSVTTVVLDAEAVTADKVKMNEAFANKLVASDFFTNTLTAKRGFINQLVSNNIFTSELTAQRGFIHQLVSNNIFTNELTAQRGFIHQLQSKIINTEVLDAFRGRIGGFNLGPFPQGGGRWIAGNNPYICGMGNGEGGGVRTAFWANWGNNWNKAGWGSWVVNTDGKMYCKNEANFYHKVDFANTCAVNFYSRPNASKGIWTGDGEINGNGSNPAGGQNAVVWWNQITTGKWRQHAGITTASDRRLKENIEPTPVKALDKIKDLNLVAFDYIKDKSYEEIGLIAQEVLDIVPNAVNEYEGKDSHLTINYAKFIPYLLKAIQELNQKINLMEERYGSII
jgi:phage minor structural protein